MTASDFMKKNGVLGAVVAGVVSALLVTRVEPFKHQFLLAPLVGAVVGILIGIIEVGIRKFVNRTRG
jgi:uncharacterized membrane protein YeaQ/YmgE (transglycosylase-associated protein family)